MAPKIKRRKSVADSTSYNDPRWDHWWNQSPFFVRDQYGKYTSRPGAEFWYEHFWKPRAFSVWAFELVRRLAKLPKLEELEPSASERAKIKRMPCYSSLSAEQKRILYAVFSTQLREYLKETDDAKETWKVKQSYKLGDWRQIEVLDSEYDESQKEQRDLAKKYIDRYWKLVKAAWECMESPHRIPQTVFHNEILPPHNLTDSTFTEEEFQTALREAGLTSQ